MKISRLKRALAGFLTAAMLIMCMPFAGITVSAAETLPAGTYVYINLNDGEFSDGNTTGGAYLTSEGKLPADTLETPTKAGFIFGGWRVYVNNQPKDYITEDYVFTDNDLGVHDTEVVIKAEWCRECTDIKLGGEGEVYNGYKLPSIDKYKDDTYVLNQYDDDPGRVTAKTIKWYSVTKGTAFDPTSATECNSSTAADSDTNDYYLYATLDISSTKYRLAAKKPTVTVADSSAATVHEFDSTTVTLSWKVKAYEVITNVSNISMTPDVTASDYKLDPGDAPSVAITAKAKTKTNKAVSFSIDSCDWKDTDGSNIYTIEAGKKYVLSFCFNAHEWNKFASDNLGVDGMGAFTSGASGYTYDPDYSDADSVYFTTPQITASGSGSSSYDPIVYLEDVTLSPTAGDTTGTSFTFNGVPELTAAEIADGYKYVYEIIPTDGSGYTPEQAADEMNNDTIESSKKPNASTGIPVDGCKDFGSDYKITVTENACVSLVKINPKHRKGDDEYHIFAAKAFGVTPTASGGDVTDGNVVYLKDVTLSPTAGDKTGTSFTFANVPALSTQDIKDGYKYIYVISPAGGSSDTVSEMINDILNSGVKINGSGSAYLPPAQCKDIPKNGKITVSEESVVYFAKINPSYKNSEGEYYIFAEVTFPVTPTAPIPETDAEKAAKAIGTALNGLDPTNDTKESDVQAIVDKNKGDTTVTVTAFDLTPATEDTAGELHVLITITDDDNNTETVEKTYVINKLPSSDPSDPSDPSGGDVIVDDAEDNVGGAGVDVTEVKNVVDITSDEQILIDSGENLYIILNVLNADNTVSAEDKALTQSVLSDGMKAGMYLDVTLLKKIGALQTAITETNAPITITFEMPADLISTDKNVTREYFIIRVHNGKADILSCTFDPATGKASFRTDRFSSYAIAYKDKASSSTPVKPDPVKPDPVKPAPVYPTPIYPSFTYYIPTGSTTASTASVSSFKEKLNVTAEAQEKTVKLSWNKIRNADGYVVYQLKDGKYVKVTTTKDTSVTFNNKTNGVTYKYMVKYTVNGRTCPTSCSGKASAMVYYKPIVTASADKNSVSLSWKAVPDADKYAVYKYVDGKAVKLAEVRGRAVLVNGLRSGAEYSYIVSAYVDGKWTTMLRSDIATVNTKA